MKYKRFAAIIASIFFVILLMPPLALATVTETTDDAVSSASIHEVSTTIGSNCVCYPQLDGVQNTAIQQTINDSVVSEANIAQRLIQLSTLQQSGNELQVTYQAYLYHDVFSVVISAIGMIEPFSSGQEYTALSFDLNTGARLTLQDLFVNPDITVEWMETQLTDGYEENLSPYLEHADLLPLPVDSFYIDQNGITFYYPNDQFTLLSGYAGAVQFQYGELQPFLISDTMSIPSRIESLLPVYADAQIQTEIEKIVSQSTLPYITIHLGDSIPDLIAQNRLERTPDHYPGGRYFQLEESAFRDVLLLSDSLTDAWDTSIVEGILAMRMNLFGIETGVTTRDRWHQILGEPDLAIPYDSYIASDYGFPIGTADTYTIADRQLMLYADENDVLYAVRLTK